MLPAPTGNGLAMRVGAQLEALADGRAGRAARGRAGRRRRPRRDVGTTVSRRQGPSSPTPATSRALRSDLARLLATPAGASGCAAPAPLPPAAAASPALAGRIADGLGELPGAHVHAIRVALAPLAVALAERLGAGAPTLDLDEDEPGEQVARLLDVFGPSFRMLSLAASCRRRARRRRHGLPTRVLPNSVELPPFPADAARVRRHRRRCCSSATSPTRRTSRRPTRSPARSRRACAACTAACVVDLVGALRAATGPVAALAARPDTRVHGYVDDLAPRYAAADVAVVALRAGLGHPDQAARGARGGRAGGVEHGRRGGLELVDGEHALLADGADAQARGRARGILADDALAARLAAAAGGTSSGASGARRSAATVRELVLS